MEKKAAEGRFNRENENEVFAVRKKRNFSNEKLSEASKNRGESITNRLIHTEERMSGRAGKVKEIPHSNTSKEKEIKTTVTVSKTSGLHTEIRPKNTCDGRRNLDNHRREKIFNKILTRRPQIWRKEHS